MSKDEKCCLGVDQPVGYWDKFMQKNSASHAAQVGQTEMVGGLEHQENRGDLNPLTNGEP